MIFRFIIATYLLFYSCIALSQNCNYVVDTPDDRYKVYTDGTVLDKKTNLMWMRCSLGQTFNNGHCEGASTTYTWQFSLQTAVDYNYAAYDDWRMPNLKELSSLINYYCDAPSINSNVFSDTPSSAYWSSTPYAYSTDFDRAWTVKFERGYHSKANRNSSYYVRLVRNN